jgi:phosphoglucosamine mutase
VTLRFGTDGVRGLANAELTPELVLALGRAAARVLRPQQVVVGRDPRVSGPLLEAALVAGFSAEGVDVGTLGVVPTPAVAYASARHDVPGAMISASHNGFADNGIKFFAAGGRKLDDAVQADLERELDRLVHSTEADSPAGGASPPVGGAVGAVEARPELGLEYADSVVRSLDGRSLEGMRIVIDCANGAAATVAPHVFRRLGAHLTVLHANPDGRNINDGCGSTNPHDLQRAVIALGADAGLAFDGDADRVLAVDHQGALVDGDHIIAICAVAAHEDGSLTDDTVVVTVMTNLGFRRAMAARGIEVIETAVGDRAVLEALEAKGLSLGGEQSGHVIFRDLATTGDGLLTGVHLLDVVRRRAQPLADLAAVMTRLPQVLRNVQVPAGVRAADIAAAIAVDQAEVESELGDAGRVLVRASGTEPLLRVMVEAVTPEDAESAASRLVAAAETAAAETAAVGGPD